MKKLFIYSSFTGNGDLVAEEFKKKGYEIRKVIEKKKFPKSFFLNSSATKSPLPVNDE